MPLKKFLKTFYVYENVYDSIKLHSVLKLYIVCVFIFISCLIFQCSNCFKSKCKSILFEIIRQSIRSGITIYIHSLVLRVSVRYCNFQFFCVYKLFSIFIFRDCLNILSLNSSFQISEELCTFRRYY